MVIDDRAYIQIRCPHDVKLKAQLCLLKRRESMQKYLYQYIETLANEETHHEEKPTTTGQDT